MVEARDLDPARMLRTVKDYLLRAIAWVFYQIHISKVCDECGVHENHRRERSLLMPNASSPVVSIDRCWKCGHIKREARE